MKRIIIIVAILIVIVYISIVIRQRFEMKEPASNINSDKIDFVEKNTPQQKDSQSTENSTKNKTYSIPAGDYTYKINYGGQDRMWLVHIPNSYNGEKPMPMILNFHGGGGTAESARASSLMNQHSDQNGYIVVYPEATGKKILGKLYGMWNVGEINIHNTKEVIADDVGFVNKIIDDMTEKFNIDEKRIYATGLSRGGMMTYNLACEMSDRIAAFAPISTSFVQGEENCNPSRPISIIHFQGTADPVIPYNGGTGDPSLPEWISDGATYLSTQESIDVFVNKNNCSPTPKNTLQKGNASCVAYNGCDLGAEIIMCSLTGAGHTWPGGTFDVDKDWWKKLVGEINYDISANEMMWVFFKKHPLQ